MALQIAGFSIVYLNVCSGAYQRKPQSSASLAFVRGSHRWPVNSPRKGPVTRKMVPFDDVIMVGSYLVLMVMLRIVYLQCFSLHQFSLFWKPSVSPLNLLCRNWRGRLIVILIFVNFITANTIFNFRPNVSGIINCMEIYRSTFGEFVSKSQGIYVFDILTRAHFPRYQSSWAPCWPHEPCYQGLFLTTNGHYWKPLMVSLFVASLDWRWMTLSCCRWNGLIWCPPNTGQTAMVCYWQVFHQLNANFFIWTL